VISDRVLQTLPVKDPDIQVREDGSMSIVFYSYFIEAPDIDEPYVVGINEWHLDADAEGHLQWTTTPIARELEYRPKST